MSVDNSKKPAFILYRGGVANLVDQEVWEQDWHRWWKSTHGRSLDGEVTTRRSGKR